MSFRLTCFFVLLAGLPSAQAQTNVFPYQKGNGLANLSAPSQAAGATTEPAKNECRTDSFYNSSVCKVVDAAEVPDSRKVVRPSYMRWAHDNADGSRYFLFANSSSDQLHIYNSSDHSLYGVPSWPSHENYEPRWDDDDPNLIYHNNGCRFYVWDVRKVGDTKYGNGTLIHDFGKDFAACQKIENGGEGTSSIGSRYWSWMVLGGYAHGNYFLQSVIVYDKQNDRIVGTLDRAKYVSQGGSALLWDSGGYRPNMVDIAPSGDRVLLLWPALKYPSPGQVLVSGGGDKVAVSDGGKQATVLHSSVNRSWNPGDSLYLSGCSGAGASLNGTHTIGAKPSDYSTELNVSGSGVPDGSYSCSTVQPAVASITVRSGTATASAGFNHRLATGDRLTISGSALSTLNTTVDVSGVPSARSFTFRTSAQDGIYNAIPGSGIVLKWQEGVRIPDNLQRFGDLKRDNFAASDGPHVYHLDFTEPVKVCNDETHSGWAWALNGNPVYVCQIDGGNWLQAEADTIGFTDIYTGIYTPVLYHADLNWEGGWHFGRFYNRNIRGWGAMALTSNPGDKNRLSDSLVLFELKKWDEQPRIWRAAKLHNNHFNYDTEAHGSLTRDGQQFFWGANWNGTSSSAVSTYRTSLPTRWWLQLTGPVLRVSDSTLHYTCIAGSPQPVAKEFTVDVADGDLTAWSSRGTQNWLTLTQSNLSGPGSVQASVSCENLPPGRWQDAIILSSETARLAGSPLTVEVTVNAVTPPVIRDEALAVSLIGIDYRQVLTATGGQIPFRWSIAEGTLCDGLSLSAEGVIAGVPASAGNCQFVARLEDAQGSVVTQSMNLRVDSPFRSSIGTLLGKVP